MQLTLAVLTGIITLIVVMLPFFVGRGGRLAAASSIHSVGELVQIRQSILKRYLEDEQAFHSKAINRLMWDQRRAYLTNRYIDTVRRLDYLQHQGSVAQAPQSPA